MAKPDLSKISRPNGLPDKAMALKLRRELDKFYEDLINDPTYYVGMPIEVREAESEEESNKADLACNLCPHDTLERDQEHDSDTVEAWICPDCYCQFFEPK